jgi:hypothetical protein
LYNSRRKGGATIVNSSTKEKIIYALQQLTKKTGPDSIARAGTHQSNPSIEMGFLETMN